MAITLEQAKALKVGTVLHHVSNRNADGSPHRWRVNGKVKTWKTRPDEVRVPIKHGLRNYGSLTEQTLRLLYLTAEEALDAERRQAAGKAL